MLLLFLSFLINHARGELEAALITRNCTAPFIEVGKSIFCPCNGDCIDGTFIGQPGLCSGYYEGQVIHLCAEVQTPPSCAPTQSLLVVDPFNEFPAEGQPGQCGGCRNSTYNSWHQHKVGWTRCDCPAGYTPPATKCEDFQYVPNSGNCYRCSTPDEELVEETPGDFYCLSKCKPSDTSCDFYQALEKNHQCGPGGYPLAYGYKFCQKYAQNSPQFSLAGQVWIKKVRKCLQKALQKDCTDKSQTCGAIQEHAFDSHPDCYVNTGFCALPYADRFAALKTVGWNVVWPFGVIPQTYEVGKRCAELDAQYYKQWLKQIEDIKKKVHDAVCAVLPSWCKSSS